MKEGDLILVSAEATGLGKPMEAVIDKIETFMGQTLVTVTYTQPDALICKKRQIYRHQL